MQARFDKLISTTQKPEVIVSHKDQSISFQISGTSRRAAQLDFDIFGYLNEYWATLKEEEQDYLFNVYVQIRLAFNQIVNRHQLNSALNKLCVELVDRHSFDRVYEWVLYSAQIQIPANFEQEYKYSYDQQGSREQTYIRSDYTKLIAMVIILKSMIPIWGEYMLQGKDMSGNDYKEYYAFHLISGAQIMQTEPMHKLMLYVECTLSGKSDFSQNILKGISSEDYPIWMLAKLIIQRLTVGDIRGLDPKANIVTYIFKFISQGISGESGNSENSIKPKSISDYDGEIADKASTLERYKIKHDVSIGEIVELAYSIRNLHEVARKLEPQIDLNLVDQSVYTVQKLQNYELKMPQLNLLRWVFKPVVSSKGMLYLDKNIIVNCLGVLEAVLWYRGFKYLSVLSTSYVDTSEKEIFLSSTDSRARIPKDLVLALDALYPFQELSGGKKTGFKKNNPAIEAIDTLVDQYSKFSWTATADENKITELFGLKENTRILLPHDLKIMLAGLVIQLGSRGRPIPYSTI
jgi:hypothetical protein